MNNLQTSTSTQLTQYTGKLSSILPINVSKTGVYTERDLSIIEKSINTQISLIECDKAKSVSISAQLMQTAIAYGFLVDEENTQDKIAFIECTEIVMLYYSDFSIDQLRHAFRVSHLTGANLESYGKRFNATYLKRVLDAYRNYVNVVLPSILTKDKIAENRKNAAEKFDLMQKEAKEKDKENLLLYPVTVAKGISVAYIYFLEMKLDFHTVAGDWISYMERKGLFNDLFNDEDEENLRAAAILVFIEQLSRKIGSSRVKERPALRNLQKSVKAGIIPASETGAISVIVSQLKLKEYFQSISFDLEPVNLARRFYKYFVQGHKVTTKEIWLKNFDFRQVESETLEKIKEIDLINEAARKKAAEIAKMKEDYG